jgi:excisionase family DNA binding protein
MRWDRPPAFRRQVNFDLHADEWPLLEQAARDHGGVRAGILAGLHALAEERLRREHRPPPDHPGARRDEPPEPTPEPEPKPARDRESEPGPPLTDDEPDELGSHGFVHWVDVDGFAELAGASPSTVRRWARDGSSVASDPRDDSRIRLDSLEIPRSAAAALVGVSSRTLAARIADGRLCESRAGYVHVTDLWLTSGQAARYLGVKADTVRRRIAKGELPASNRDGQHEIWLLDVLAHAGVWSGEGETA